MGFRRRYSYPHIKCIISTSPFLVPASLRILSLGLEVLSML